MQPFRLWFSFLALWIALMPLASLAQSENEKKASARETAQQFIADTLTLSGHPRSLVIEKLGLPESKKADEGYEVWIYRRRFGTFRRNKAIFGYNTMTFEVRAEILIKGDTVLSSKASPIEEIRKPRRD